MSRRVLTQELLKAMLDYSPATGFFHWRRREDAREQWNGRYAGTRAGYPWKATGGGVYRSIRIYDRPYAEHRLAWLYMTGELPAVVVDHIDRDGENNSWDNLRAATRSENAANAGAWKSNKLGVRGVCVERRSGLFRATIRIDGRQKSLGLFDTLEEAAQAYSTAALQKSGVFAGARQ